jgi:hypothetical protein
MLEISLREARMHFDLIDDRNNGAPGVGKQPGEREDREIRYTD